MEKNKTQLSQFILVTLLYFVFYIIISPIISGIITLLFNPYAKTNNVFVVFILEYFVLIATILLLLPQFKHGFKILLKEKKKTLIVVCLGVAILYATGILTTIITLLFNASGNSLNQSLVESNARMYPLYMLFSTTVFAPIVEEGVFRATIQNFLRNKLSKHVSIFISAFIFGFLHVVVGLLQGNLLELIYMISYVSLGVVLGYFYERYSLSRTILIHAIYNFIGFLSIMSM